jgi:hypothetical protein
MSVGQIVLGLVFVAFSAFTGYVFYAQGAIAFVEWATKSPVGIQLSLDLVIALTLVAGWMIGDARRRGVSAVPYVVLTLFLGSIGPMLYLLRRPASARPA